MHFQFQNRVSDTYKARENEIVPTIKELNEHSTWKKTIMSVIFWSVEDINVNNLYNNHHVLKITIIYKEAKSLNTNLPLKRLST